MFCQHCKREVEIIKVESDNSGTKITSFSCGHRHTEKTCQESLKIYGLTELKKKGEKNFSKNHDYEYEQITGERVGKNGILVSINRIIDRVKDFYKEVVIKGNEVIRDKEEKLSEHHKGRHKTA
jgi:hypothetical protein